MKGKSYFKVLGGGLVLAFGVLSLGAQCVPKTPGEGAEQAAAKAYAAEQVACSAQHDAAEDALRCREEVRKKWGVYEDGGRRED